MIKKITFKVSVKKEGNVLSLIKDVNQVSCRIQIDLERGFVTIENIADTMSDFIIELIDKYFVVTHINIDNTTDESTSLEIYQNDITNDETKKAVNLENKPTVIEPQSKDDLIVKKVEFQNEYVENLINLLARTAYWAMYAMKSSEKEIGSFILGCKDEISMRFKKCIKYSVGDIVDCNYGTHLPREINGRHVYAIVCNILPNGMAYLVPITKVTDNLTSTSYIKFNTQEDMNYYIGVNTTGTALLDRGKYLRAERFDEVIGKITNEFLTKILNQLCTTFDFRYNTNDNTKNDSNDDIIKSEIPDVVEEIVDTTTKGNNTEPIFQNTNNSETAISVSKASKNTKKITGEESVLLSVIGESLDKLNRTKTVKEQIETFLTDIGMTTQERMITQSFVIACTIKKITYDHVIIELHNMFPKVREDIIKSTLQEQFKKWLALHPEIVERYPKISLMSMLKIFAKRFT